MYQRFYDYCKDIKYAIKNNDWLNIKYDTVYPEDIDDDTILWLIDDIENIISQLGYTGKIDTTFNLMYRTVYEDSKIIEFKGSFTLIDCNITNSFLIDVQNGLLNNMQLSTVNFVKTDKSSEILLNYTKTIKFNEL